VEIAATFVDVDEATAQRIVLADNRTADLGGYDDARLADLLEEVAAQGARELEATGYNQAYLDDLLAALEAREFHTDPDHVPALPDSTVSTPGTLWLLGRHRLLCGDATSADDVARLMDGKRARLMATDPPYLVGYDGSNHPQSTVNFAMTRNKQWDEYVDPPTGQAFYEAFIAVAYEHALVEDTPVYQWHADMRRSLLVAAWESHGLLAHQTIIWVKSRAVLTRSDFMWRHEPCLFGWRKGSRPPTERRAPANETTVWQVDQQGSSNDIHPTEKPVKLFARPLRWHLRPGEIAFEPFAGSGTQIIAAEMERRTCFALELVSCAGNSLDICG
jgi:DNA modification methylase